MRLPRLLFLSIGEWIYDFQTLITGILAVSAALYAAKFAQKQVSAANAQIEVAREQITASKEQADRERAAKLRAARASLPTTLSSICEYAQNAQNAGQALNAAWPSAAKMYPEDHDPNAEGLVTAKIPDSPHDILISLERIVELTDAEDVAERIESILREAQVFSSRTRPLANGVQISTDLLAIHIVQACALHARAESLFTYARRKTKGVNSADLWDRTIAALSIMSIYTPAVHEEAMRQRAKGQPPGEADSIEPQ